jgi:hypothetical protein
MSVRAVITFIVIAGTVSIGLLYAVATLDPLTATVTGYDLGGMESQVNGIHKMLVQYMVLVAIGSPLLWVVFRILRQERQQV